MRCVCFLLVPGLLVVSAQLGCQSGGNAPFNCITDADCPPDCRCPLLGSAPSSTCDITIDDEPFLCGGTCDRETICPDGTSCRYDDEIIEVPGTNPDGNPFLDIAVFRCTPDSGAGGSGGSGGTGGSPTAPATESPVSCAQSGDVMAIADAFVRGGTSATEDYQNTSYGTRGNLTIKSIVDLRFSRKIYIVFDLTSAPSTFEKASLVLTLIRHIVSPRDPDNSSGPQPVDVYGIVDDNDWDPATLAEDEITWINAPRNDTTAGNAFEASPGVPKLISGYDFDLGSDGVADVGGTKYALDITEYVRGRLDNDADKKITVLMAISTMEIDVEGSEFKSRDIPEGEMCDRPFLHFE